MSNFSKLAENQTAVGVRHLLQLRESKKDLCRVNANDHIAHHSDDYAGVRCRDVAHLGYVTDSP